MKRVVYFCVLLLGTLGTACYDTGDAEDCVGFTCPGGFQWPAGGEVRSWYIELPNGGHISRFFGIFIADEDPASPDLVGSRNTRPLPDLGRCAPDINGVQGLNRQYMDVGPEMTFTLGPDETITVPRISAEDNAGMPFVDPYGREHDIIYYREDFNVRTNSFFDFNHTATATETLPFQVRDKATGKYESTNALEGLYMPPAIEVLDPPPGVAEFKRGQPFNVEWTSPPPNPDVAVFASIVIVPGGPGSGLRPWLCPVGNTGQFTIPADIIDSLQADDGIMLVGLVADQAVLTDAGRMFQKFGISCDLVSWVRGE